MKKKLIIGGSGFIGKYLIESMEKEDAQIINFDKKNLKYNFLEALFSKKFLESVFYFVIVIGLCIVIVKYN